MERRKFTQSLATSIAGISLAHSFGYQGLNLGQKKLGIALVGLGNYATRQLAPALMETQMCALKGIVTGTPSKIDQWKKTYDLKDHQVYNYDNFDSIASSIRYNIF